MEIRGDPTAVIETSSYGMKRRINIPAGLLHDPKVIYMDEPTVGIDPQSRRRILDTVKRLREQRGMTVLYTTHLMIEAQKLSNRFGIIDHGEIIALGTPGELILQVGEQDRLIFTVGEAAVGNETLERIRRPVLWILKPGNIVRSMVGGDNLIGLPLRRKVMPEKISIFRSPESEAQYSAAYDAMLGKWPLPYEERFIPTRFGDTHLIVSGPKDAPALILFHSAGSGAAQWFRNVGPLGRRYRTYAVDTIGEVNKSVATRRLKSCRDGVDWAADLFDGLEIGKVDIVGNSFGGFLAFNTALYLPQRVKKAVLISPAATFVQMWAFYTHLAFPYKIGYALGSNRIILSGFHWIWRSFPRDAVFKKYTELGKISGFPCNQLTPPVYSDEDLRRVRIPILLLIGEREVIYKPGDAIGRATRLVPGLKAEIVPNANHNAQVTAPDLVNAKILDFLAG